eukprot:TRINITY_DN30362_c0_g1_i1.p1 TRINITY_DN30362_c0_g1~~TRINITY_DN30362_c0_g1_i1.p1  ORF type:complete len:275 (+),score=29.08 TRINITY_DN30362_c0_g1_i1:76-825(+)
MSPLVESCVADLSEPARNAADVHTSSPQRAGGREVSSARSDGREKTVMAACREKDDAPKLMSAVEEVLVSLGHDRVGPDHQVMTDCVQQLGVPDFADLVSAVHEEVCDSPGQHCDSDLEDETPADGIAKEWQKNVHMHKSDPPVFERRRFKMVRSGTTQVESHGFYRQSLLAMFPRLERHEDDGSDGVCRSLHDVVRFGKIPIQDHRSVPSQDVRPVVLAASLGICPELPAGPDSNDAPATGPPGYHAP